MNKNTIIGSLLLALVLMFYMNNKAKENKQEAVDKIEVEEKALEKEIKEKATAVQLSEEVKAIESGDSAALAQRDLVSQQKFGSFSKNVSGTEKIIVLENELLKLELSNKGAQIKKLELKNYKTWEGKPLILIDNSQSLNFNFKTKENKLIDSKNLFYDIEKIDNQTVSLKLKVSENQYVEQKFSIKDDSYFVDYDMFFVNLENVLQNNFDLSATWDFTVIKQEKELKQEQFQSSIYWKIIEDGEIDKLSKGSSDEEEIPASDWLAYKDKYFNVTLLTNGAITNGKVKSTIDSDDTTRVADYTSTLNFDKQNAYKMQYFFGPNDYKLLKSFETGQEEIVELSSDFFIFSWIKHITKWIVLPIFHFLENFGFGYGIIIIILTLIIRMGMMPLTFKSYVSTAKTKLLKPQLDALKEKYKDDQSKYAQEQMKLYQSTGVSMFGGCLPMLIQMPFFLAMFYFFPSSIELRGESFWWATDLSTYDVLISLPFNIPMYGSHVSGFTLLMTISSLVMAKFNPQMQNQNTQPGMEMMKYMPYIFPFFLMFMFNTWAAGLTLYYFVSNLTTLGQQLFINKFMINEDKLRLQLEENKKKKPKKGGFREKLSDAYKKQQEIESNKKK